MVETITVTSYRDVVTAFADPALVVPEVASPVPGSSFDWLRTSVSRFANGDNHARARALVEADLAALQPVTLRAEATALTFAAIDAAPVRFDLMAVAAQVVPVTVLAGAVGVDREARPATVLAVNTVAGGYRDPGDAAVRAEADDSVDRLVAIFGGGRTEVVANRIGLLVQACDATAGLIGNSAAIALRSPAASVTATSIDSFVAEVARFDPPVRLTRRVARAAVAAGAIEASSGDVVVLDLAAANRDPSEFADPHRFEPARVSESLTFGAGPRSCPGQSLAIAIAAGALEAIIARCRLADPEVPVRPSPNLSVPLRLDVDRR